jgi:hypothetical protein
VDESVILLNMATEEPPGPNERTMAGVRAGIARAERTNLPYFEPFAGGVIDPRLQRPLDCAEERLEGEAASGRFTELFAEMLTVAVVAREAYGDPELTEEEIDSYLDHSLSIFNSFRHP